MTPWWLQALGYLAGLFVAFSVGFWFGDHTRGRRDAWDHARDLDDIAQLAGDLAEAEQAIELLGQSTLRAWKQTLAAQDRTRRPDGEGFWMDEGLADQQRTNREAN
jgi:hypothetical protein